MLEVRAIHDCDKPSMVLDIVVEFEWVVWPFFRRKVKKKIYEERDATFVCDVCGARWEWWNPTWFCRERPEVWTKVDTGIYNDLRE